MTSVRSVASAIGTYGRGVVWTPSGSVPLFSRALYAREMAAWSLIPLMMGAAEGGVAGVLAKNTFAEAVSGPRLNLAVAIVSGTPALANITSFLWNSFSHGRDKIRFIVGLQIATVVLVASIALIPITPAGLLALVFAVAASRVCWSGVVTLRSTVWRANYPRHLRASLAGRFAAVQAVMMTATVTVLGLALNAHPDAFRLVYPIAAVAGLAGARIYSGLRVRGHLQLRRAELESAAPAHLANPLSLRRVLLDDAGFRRYMTCMFVFGTGNLMVTAPLIVILKDRLSMSPFHALLITTAIPIIVMPVFIPLWSRLLDRTHIVRFRAVHSWAFVASTSAILIGAAGGLSPLLWIGAALKGVAFAGGVLGWNLGHHDFAKSERASSYMAVHVTLTGIRGMVAPITAIAIYQLLEWRQPGSGVWVFAACLVLTLMGAIGFVRWRPEQGAALGG